MKKLIFIVVMNILGFELPAFASEFHEHAMCLAQNSNAAFPRLSLQSESAHSNRGVLILMASDGWTQVYSGLLKTSASTIEFREDKQLVSAHFIKTDFKASISFNGDTYLCDERSFGD